MAQIKVAACFFGRSKYREAEIARSLISLKLMFRDAILVNLITDQKSYIDSCHGQMLGLYPIILSDRSFADRTGLEDYYCFYFGADNPESTWFAAKKGTCVEIPVDKSMSLGFNSKVYGNLWTYPKLSYMADFIKSRGIEPRCHPFVI